jgi:hypothetical protein
MEIGVWREKRVHKRVPLLFHTKYFPFMRVRVARGVSATLARPRSAAPGAPARRLFAGHDHVQRCVIVVDQLTVQLSVCGSGQIAYIWYPWLRLRHARVRIAASDSPIACIIASSSEERIEVRRLSAGSVRSRLRGVGRAENARRRGVFRWRVAGALWSWPSPSSCQRRSSGSQFLRPIVRYTSHGLTRPISAAGANSGPRFRMAPLRQPCVDTSVANVREPRGGGRQRAHILPWTWSNWIAPLPANPVGRSVGMAW